MALKIVLLVVVLAAMLQLGSSLQCWKCNGCESSSMNKEPCRQVDSDVQTAACLTQVVRVGATNEQMTVKKCAIFDKNTQFTCDKLPDTAEVSCVICHGDYCNGAPSISPLSSAIAGLLLLCVFNGFIR